MTTFLLTKRPHPPAPYPQVWGKGSCFKVPLSALGEGPSRDNRERARIDV